MEEKDTTLTPVPTPTVNRIVPIKLETEMKDHIRRQISGIKVPRWIEFVPELPKTATGKIQRFRLRG